MKTLYLECGMGAAGDMLMAALLELIEDRSGFIDTMNKLGLAGVHVEQVQAVKCGITGTHVDVHIHGHSEQSEDVPIQGHIGNDSTHTHAYKHQAHHEHSHGHSHEHNHGHTGLQEICQQIYGLPVSQNVKNHASSIYRIIADAEARAHGRPVSEVHFHEVGSIDAVADIVGACMLIEEISPDKIIASPVHVGSGFVRCEHGVLPVPAPATAHILQGVPIYAGSVKGELCTPTGAAILKHFVAEFGSMPAMAVEKIGYGMGKKDYEAANCVRAFLGVAHTAPLTGNDTIAELSCNLDDMTGEAIGYAIQVLFDQGARDVFTVPVQMKKNRPGVLLVCICEVADADRMAGLILRHTTTFGLRKTICHRYVLDRAITEVQTEYGPMRRKSGTGYGVSKSKLEYEDIAAAAEAANVSIGQIYQSLRKGL